MKNTKTKNSKTAKSASKTVENGFAGDMINSVVKEEFARLDEIQKTLYEIRDLLRERRDTYKYPIPKWTETPKWDWDRIHDPTYPSWPPTPTPTYPTDPYGGPILYCGTSQAHRVAGGDFNDAIRGGKTLRNGLFRRA